MQAIKKSIIMADLNQFLQEYYAEPLKKEGFVSCENSYFDWYKIENDLVYSVHFPIHGTMSYFIILEPGICVLPLYVWDEIPMRMPLQDNPWTYSSDRFKRIRTEDRRYLDFIEKRTSPLKRKSYCTPGLIAGLPCGKRLLMLDSERRGAEILDEIAFPLLSGINSVEDLYRYNLEERCAINDYPSRDHYAQALRKKKEECAHEYYLTEEFSTAFADECVAVRDEEFYPYVMDSLKATYTRCTRVLEENCPAKKRNPKYFAHESERSALLLRVMQEKDYGLWEESIAAEREKMMQQIHKKLPSLSIDK